MGMDSGQDPILLTPGPVQIDTARFTELRSMHHRSDAFRALVLETGRLLAALAGSSSAPFLLAASGTGAMESIITNCVAPGERVLVASAGRFGRRWAQIARSYDCDVDLLEFKPGSAVDGAEVVRRASETHPALLALTHVESSTGVRTDIAAISAGLPGNARPLVAVDAIASLGSEEFHFDRWGIDCAAGAGQKALAAPPGVSFVFASRRARQAARDNSRPRFYFSFERYEAGEDAGETPFTPPVTAVQMLYDSLLIIQRTGLEAVLRRHAACSRALIEAAEALGLRSLARMPSSSVQAFLLPRGIGCQALLEHVASHSGVTLAGGQDEMQGRIIRAGFPGIHGGETIERLVRGLAAALADAGIKVDPEAAVARLGPTRELAPLFQPS